VLNQNRQEYLNTNVINVVGNRLMRQSRQSSALSVQTHLMMATKYEVAIKKMTIFLILSIAFLLLFGCNDSQIPFEDREPVVRIPEEMISLYIGYTDMVRTSAYYYSLWEKDDEILFSCYFFIEDDYDEIMVEDISIDSRYMEQLREIVKKYRFTDMEYMDSPTEELPFLFAPDAPIYSLRMYFPRISGEHTYSDLHWLNYHPAGTDVVIEFFIELREKYVSKINSEN
jgi:hypothetical protein